MARAHVPTSAACCRSCPHGRAATCNASHAIRPTPAHRRPAAAPGDHVGHAHANEPPRPRQHGRGTNFGGQGQGQEPCRSGAQPDASLGRRACRSRRGCRQQHQPDQSEVSAQQAPRGRECRHLPGPRERFADPNQQREHEGDSDQCRGSRQPRRAWRSGPAVCWLAGQQCHQQHHTRQRHGSRTERGRATPTRERRRGGDQGQQCRRAGRQASPAQRRGHERRRRGSARPLRPRSRR